MGMETNVVDVEVDVQEAAVAVYSGMDYLTKIDSARQALIEAKTVSQTKTILDKAEAVAAFTRQQSMSREIQDYANEFVLDAQIKLGKLLKEMPKNEGGGDGSNQHKRATPTKLEGVAQTPTYSGLGITYKDAAQWQDMAGHEAAIRDAVKTKKERGEPITAAKVVNEVRRKAKEKENTTKKRDVPLPEGKYDVIVIDPPWPMEKVERECRPNQVKEIDYPIMTEAELKALKVPSADDCHLWLWTTHRFMPMAFGLLEHWKFKYVCCFVWHKNGGFQPFGLPQYNCEFILYARKGQPKFIDTKDFFTCLNAPRGKHSEKPELFYEMVRRVTGGERLDMFSRRKIEGFKLWGNEVAE